MEQIKHLNMEYLIFRLDLNSNLHALRHKNLNNQLGSSEFLEVLII